MGIKRVGFTGGDPFLLRQDLLKCVERAKHYDMRTMVITSAYWATSEATARRVLEPYSIIDILGLSSDRYHQPFVPVQYIANAISAARQTPISHVEVQVTGPSETSLEEMRAQLGALGHDVPVRFQKLWPVGRATELMRKDELRRIGEISLDCPMGSPFVMASGEVVGCCSAAIQLGDNNPMKLGTFTIDNLAQVIRGRDENRYYHFLRRFGWGPLIEYLSKEGWIERESIAVSDVCHLCYQINADSALRRRISNLFEPEDPVKDTPLRTSDSA
jgi:hypothetical protein